MNVWDEFDDSDANVALIDDRQGLDSTSDRSEWVRQYGEWYRTNEIVFLPMPSPIG